MSRKPDMARPASAILGGFSLKNAEPDIWRIRPEEARTVERLPTGAVREFVLAPRSPDLPEIPTVHTFSLRWSNLPIDHRGIVRRIVARPGALTLVLWRSEELTWRSDGVRRGFKLRNGWTHAVDGDPAAPPGHASVDFEPEFRLDPVGDPLDLFVKDPEAYGSGDPAEGEVWRERGTGAFKLGAPIPAGSAIYGTVIPVYQVVRIPSSQGVELKKPVIEPAEWEFLENAAGGSP